MNYSKHDTEVVAAIKSNENRPSHQHDLAKLIRRSQEHDDHPEAEAAGGLSSYENDLRSRLSKAVFVGHVNTDLDSVAGAIGAAALFGGTPALSEPLNSLNGEIRFALNNSGVEPPKQFDTITDANECDVCLVDHTEEKQMVPSLRDCPDRTNRIVGVIDHHALAASFRTARPIYMDLRPWGSMSTIVGYLFVSHRRALPRPIAVLLLQAILSDTLNLRSVTTTDADRSMVALLSSYGGIGNDVKRTMPPEGIEEKTGEEGGKSTMYEDTEIDLLAKKQFQAKTDWIVGLGSYEMVRGDQKDFTCGSWKIGISVLEVTDVSSVLKVAGDILFELRLLKKEKGLVTTEVESSGKGGGEGDSMENMRVERAKELDFAFLFVVDVVKQNSVLLICGGRELALAREAFLDNEVVNADGNSVYLKAAKPGILAPGRTIQAEETAMVLPNGYVSRKAQFVPCLFDAINNDFLYDAKGPVSEEISPMAENAVDIKSASVLEQLSLSKNRRRPQARRKSSLRSNDLQITVRRESTIDERLVQVNEVEFKKRHGNLYDEMGRVVRAYA